MVANLARLRAWVFVARKTRKAFSRILGAGEVRAWLGVGWGGLDWTYVPERKSIIMLFVWRCR
jgi:hypothetical protein